MATHRNGNDRVAPILLPAILLAAVGALFGRTLDFGFANVDDVVLVLDNPLVHGLSTENLRGIFTHFSVHSYYPTRLVSLAIDYAAWGPDPAGYHLTNVLLHGLNVVFLYLLLSRLARSAGLSGDMARWCGFPAALIFAVHPVVVEPVAWIGGREELLMLLFGLGCVATHARAVSVRGGMSVVWHILSAYLAVLSVTSNVMGVAWPLVCVAHDAAVLRERSVGRLVAGNWHLLLVSAAGVFLKAVGLLSYDPGKVGYVFPTLPEALGNLPALASRLRATATNEWGEVLRLGAWNRSLVVVSLYAKNLATMVCPAELPIWYDADVPESAADPWVVGGGLLIGGTAWLLWRNRKRPLIAFGLLWFLAGLLPSSQIVGHHTYRADRFLYLPLAGLALAAAAAACRSDAARRRRRARTLVMVLAMLLFARSAMHVGVWKDGETLLLHSIRVNPDAAFLRHNLGNEYARQGRDEKALQMHMDAWKRAPLNAMIFHRLYQQLSKTGRYGEAAQLTRTLIALKPGDPSLRNNLGAALSDAGMHEAAIAAYDKSIALDPDNAASHNNIALEYSRTGRDALAVEHYRKALALAPENPRIHYNLARALERTGRYAQARKHMSIAERLDPDFSAPDGGVYHGR
ncbi:MAG: tetratricopeptide repeat protein [Desulfatibacillaceae bacterium]